MRAYEVTVICNDAPGVEYKHVELWAAEPTESDAREIGRVSNGNGGIAIWYAKEWRKVWVIGDLESRLRKGSFRLTEPKRIER